ncbi:MAG: SPOR domain-containing protein [Spirochaetales bacterium]|nr:SPOR domain-containing protein [Spirochaetales bacterium]
MNKILWVILSISLLFLVVILGGIWLLNAKTPGGAVTTASAELPVDDIRNTYTNPGDPFEHTMKNVPLPGMQEPDNTTSNGYYKKDTRMLGEQEQSKPIIESSGKEDAAKTEPVRYETKTTEPMKKTVTTPQTVKKTAPTTPPVTAQKNSYYIQTGAFRHKSNADANNEILVENGLGGRIFSETVKGSQFYTVLIGPYATKTEAQKFLAWIKEINGMETSYITYKP